MARANAKFMLVFLIIGILLLSAGNPALAQKWGEVSSDEWQIGPPTKMPEAPAAILFDIGQVTISYDPFQITLERHVRIKIFKKDAGEDAATVEIPLEDGDVIRGLEAQTISPGGKKTKVKDTFNKKVDDIKVMAFTFPVIEDGAVLEYRYRLVHERFRELDPWYFQNDWYTYRSNLSVIMQPGFSYDVVRINIPEALRDPVIKQGGSFIDPTATYTWELTDLMPAADEPYMAAKWDVLTSLRFNLVSYIDGHVNKSFVETWPKIGKRVEERFRRYTGNQEGLARVADSLCGEETAPPGKIKCLYTWVRDNIETRSASQDVDEALALLKLGHGTASEKNLTLVGLLRSQGITAHPLYIGRRDRHALFNTEVRRSSQFDRVLCQVDDDSLGGVYDAGDESAIFPYLPPKDLVERGLIINGDSTGPVALQHFPRPSGTSVISSLDLRPDGSALCSTNVIIQGHDLSAYTRFIKDSIASSDIVDQFVDKDQLEFALQSAARKYDPDSDQLSFDIVLEFPRLGVVTDGTIFFSPLVADIMPGRVFSAPRRTFPVDFCYPRSVQFRTIVRLPSGMTAADLPADVTETIPDGLFSRSMRASETMIEVKAKLALQRPLYPVGEYGGLKKLFETMSTSFADKIAVAPAAR